ncbi:hypothetical protein MJO29_006972 [Puccinia striiformis f. sp. tritici]|nr:hypothetical protein MJO29_006972 [Puccinia striiformis f. sp. tritici]
MERAGQAALSDALNTEEHLLNTVLQQGTHRLEACDMKGKVTIPSGSSLAPNTPKILKDLLVGKSTDGPREVSRGPVFTLQGALVHKIGPIAPAVNRRPAFAQMFVVGQGGLAEARERLEVALGKVPTKDAKANMDTTIILDIQKWLYKYNPYAKLYKQAGDLIRAGRPVTMFLKPVEVATVDDRRYNLPTANEVGIVIEGSGAIEAPRQIVLHQHDGCLKFISDLHSSYFPLRYPLLFPFGSQQWEPNYQKLVCDGKSSINHISGYLKENETGEEQI